MPTAALAPSTSPAPTPAIGAAAGGGGAAAAAPATAKCNGCQVVLDIATSTSAIEITAADGTRVIESVTSYVFFSAFRVESTVTVSTTRNGVVGPVNVGNVVGCAVSTQFTSTLAVASSYPLPATTTLGYDTLIASSFLSSANLPACGTGAPNIVLERLSEQALDNPISANAVPTSSILLPSTTSAYLGASSAPTSSSHPPSVPVQMGIGIGVGIGAAAVGLLVFHNVRRWRRRRALATAEKGMGSTETGFASKAELPSRTIPEADGADWTREADSTPCYELPAEEVAEEKA